MRRARNQTVPTRSAFPATPRNSPPRKLFHCVASARESPAPASLFPCRSRLKSAPSSPWVPRGRPSRRHGASPPRVQSSGQIVLRSSNAAAAHHFPFQEWPDDWTRGGDAPCLRDGRPRGTHGLDGADFRRERHGKRLAGAGDSRALATQWKSLRGGELRGVAGNADRVGTVWLRARRIYRRGAAEKREIRAGLRWNDFPG